MALLGVFHTHHFQICKFHFFLIFYFLHFGFLNLCKYIFFCRLVAEKVWEKRRKEKKSKKVLNFVCFFFCLTDVCLFFCFSFGYIRF